MPNDGVSIERITPEANLGRNIIEAQSLPREISEVLKPSQEVIHQTGLELVNTRLLIDQLSKTHGAPTTVDMVSSSEWDTLFKGRDIVWFMGIYQPSEASRQHAVKYSDQYKSALPDLDSDRDIVASPFAIPDYTPNPKIAADWESWDKMVEKLHVLKKKVFVDFVPNHVATDHPWALEHPEYFIQGNDEQYNANPNGYQRFIDENGNAYYLAHGKDPNFPEWADTLQLNYASPAVQEEMKKILFDLTKHSDGVRCDMAMLLNADTFLRTWGSHLTDEGNRYIKNHNFWEEVIPEVKEHAKTARKDDFLFVAEAYWNKEELGQYFDYIYGKDFYDHLKRIVTNNEKPGQNLKDHVSYLMTAAKKGRHYRDVLFTENHDEGRAVREFGKEPSKAVAALTGLIPESIFLINQGQEDGRRIKPPMQIARFPDETPDEDMQRFYERLLALKRSKLFQEGNYKLADISTGYDSIIALQVTLKPEATSPQSEREMGAIVCINIGHATTTGRLPEVGKDRKTEVYRLNDGGFVKNPDMERVGGMYVELIPWETQVIFYADKAASD